MIMSTTARQDYEKLAIFGTAGSPTAKSRAEAVRQLCCLQCLQVRARRGAELKVLSAVETKATEPKLALLLKHEPSRGAGSRLLRQNPQRGWRVWSLVVHVMRGQNT